MIGHYNCRLLPIISNATSIANKLEIRMGVSIRKFYEID